MRFVHSPIPLSSSTPELAASTEREFRRLSGQLWDGLPFFIKTPAEISAGVTPVNYAYAAGNVKRFGALASNSNAANKAALQQAISAATIYDPVVVVPSDISYGYKVSDLTTHPSFTGITVPVIVADYGPGNSYAGFPTAYDGAQARFFYNTPFTTVTGHTFTGTLSGGATSATLSVAWAFKTGLWTVTFSNGDVRQVTLTNGATTATWSGGLSGSATASFTYLDSFHDGNGQRIIGPWAPYLWIDNKSAVANPSVNGLDNRRANLFFGNDGVGTWGVGQGTNSGAGLTPDQLTNFNIACFGSSVLGDYIPFLIERHTGNIGFGIGTNTPQASYYFYSLTTGFAQMVVESNRTGPDTTCSIYLRQGNNSAQDVAIINRAGQLCLNISAQGDCMSFDLANRRATFGSAWQQIGNTITYTANMTPDATVANVFRIVATNNTAFSIGVPSGTPTQAMRVSILLKNTSGGALGTITWAAGYKMDPNWVTASKPANGFKTITDFIYDVADSVWNQVGIAVAVPN